MIFIRRFLILLTKPTVSIFKASRLKDNLSDILITASIASHFYYVTIVTVAIFYAPILVSTTFNVVLIIWRLMMKTLKALLATSTLLFSMMASAGEFGDHCTTGLSKGAFIQTKCTINEIFNGKTYCFGNEGARDSFLLDPASYHR
jgi:YHS domain-containing protein